MNEYYTKLIKQYDYNKLNTKSVELFEIINKYELYKKKTDKPFLKPLYEIVYLITLFIAKTEAKEGRKRK